MWNNSLPWVLHFWFPHHSSFKKSALKHLRAVDSDDCVCIFSVTRRHVQREIKLFQNVTISFIDYEVFCFL